MFAEGKPVKLPVNSGNKFVEQLKQKNEKRFDTAQKLISPKLGKLRQTKLYLAAHNGEKKLRIDKGNNHVENPEYILMPMPNNIMNTNKLIVKTEGKAVSKTAENPTTTVKASGSKDVQRNMIFVIGRVDFCMKMHKMYEKLNIMWDVYGKLLKITPGRQNFEQILLMRNEYTGPVLQSIYYDFEDDLRQFQKDCFLRAVGRFIGENRLQSYKIQLVDESTWRQNFTRIENVTSFVLKKNNI